MIKTKYEPTDLFIVKAGVGSERWDTDGFCRIYVVHHSNLITLHDDKFCNFINLS